MTNARLMLMDLGIVTATSCSRNNFHSFDVSYEVTVTYMYIVMFCLKRGKNIISPVGTS